MAGSDRKRRPSARDALGTRRSARWRRGEVLAVCAAIAVAMGANSARAQLALPQTAPATPIELGVDAAFTIDLGTLTPRPVLEIEAVPDASHPDIELEIELTNFTGFFADPTPVCATGGPFGTNGTELLPTTSFVSDPATGTQSLRLELFPCRPDESVFVGTTVDVRVRALSFGSGGAPATADIEIRSITLPPFNEFLGAATGPRTIAIDPEEPFFFKDTTIYEDNPTFSNGEGEFLWAGTEFTPGAPPTREERRSLIAIDLTGRVPAGATVNDAELVLEATDVRGGGGDVSIYEVITNPLSPWIEGRAQGPGDEFDGANRSPAANWIYRRATTQTWTTPGGDFLMPALDVQNVTAPGSVSFQSPALAGAVQTMIDLDEDEDGFLLRGPGEAASQTEAVQFASSDNTTSTLPQLRVTYTPVDPSSEGEFFAGTLSFIDEGQNLRWIYDTDNDDILVTDIDGVCEVDTTGDLDVGLPYSYDYNGTPGFVGYDCCMWQIESGESQVLGTGQAIFYHNLDPTDPSDLPPDFDGDGIRDVCDNCIYTPNGPLLGSCVGGATPGTPCQSDQECGSGATCDLSQTDDDLDEIGNACPEPGFGVMLATGAIGLAGSRRRGRPGSTAPDRRRPCRRPVSPTDR